MENEQRHLFIEIEKKGDNYDATLSDDSIDRDDEFFSPDVIKEWGAEGGTIPFLADHVNKMSSLVGGWTNRRVVEESNHFALKMEPKFFSSEANPLATQIKNQIDEAKAMGLRVGVSIGFIPISGHVDTKTGRYMHTKAELLEGSAVPVQSNRHASISLAKAFALKSGGFKKTSHAPELGGNMPTLEEVQTENTTLRTKVTELEGKSTLTEDERKAIEATKKELEELKKKSEDETAKLNEELAAAKEKIKQHEDELNKAKGKISAAKLGKLGAVGQDGTPAEQKFNAAKAYLESKGIPVNE